MTFLKRLVPQNATPEVTARRRAICAGCEFKKTIPVVNREVCGACGCLILSKTGLANAKCPKGKW